LQWNCCGIKSKLPHLRAISYSFDVLCIQESLLRTNDRFWIKGFIRKDIVASNERDICILISDKLIFSVIDLSPFVHSSIEIQSITLIRNNESLGIYRHSNEVNIYRHSNKVIPLSILDNLLYFLFAKYKNVIAADVNVHYSWWGCDHEDSAGKTLSRLNDIHNLIIINDRLPTILLPPNIKRSIIDLVLVSSSLAPLCYSFTEPRHCW